MSSQSGRVAPLLSVLALEPQLCRLRDEGTSLALRGVPFASYLSAKVSAYTDDITIFVSYRSDIKAEKKAVDKYEEVTGAKIKFDQSEGQRLVS